MAIKVKKRAAVTDEFQEAYQEVAEAVLRQTYERLQATPREYRARFLKNNRGLLARLTPLALGTSGPGVGMDLEVARLRAMDFEVLDVIGFGNHRYFRACTPEDMLIEEVDRTNNKRGLWDAGGYEIYVPVTAATSGRSNDIHFVPMRDPFTGARHMHHRATPSDGRHYLEFSCSTCWSQFGTPVVAVMREANLSELFRMLRIFVGRYYSGSPLVMTSHMRFARRAE